MHGVAHGESVADHSFGVAFIALILAELADQTLDRTKLLTMALLHDLPESAISDIPAPAAARLPPGAKRVAETEVLNDLLGCLPDAGRWLAWWQELEAGISVEARIVHDADRLDMLIQAHIYEQTTGNRWLIEFWPPPGTSPFELDAARALYQALLTRRRQTT